MSIATECRARCVVGPPGHHRGDGLAGAATVLVALVLPLAAVIYLVSTTAWAALEQAVLRRPQAAPVSADVDRR